MSQEQASKLDYHTIRTHSGQTGYLKLGSGAPLIMVVGYSGNLLHWNSELINQLAQQFTVYLPDNRLVGLSNSHNPASMEGLATDLVDFIDALELASVLLIGWSMGGIIAQVVALNYPQRVSGLGLIVSQPDYSYTRGNLHHLVRQLREQPGRENRDKLTELFFSESPSVEYRKYLAKAILAIKGYVHPFAAAAQELQDVAVAGWQSNPARLKNLSHATLITTAINDQVTDPAASWYLHQTLPNSKLISFPHGGHFFMHRYPRELATAFRSFFAALNF